MAMGQQNFQSWWAVVMSALRFFARLPVALFLILGAGMLAFLLLMFMVRATQWIWTNFLRTPW